MGPSQEAELKVTQALEVIPLVTIGHTARVLREARKGLWFSTGRGVRLGRPTDLQVFNLAIAAAAGPPIRAVETAETFGSMTASHTDREKTEFYPQLLDLFSNPAASLSLDENELLSPDVTVTYKTKHITHIGALKTENKFADAFSEILRKLRNIKLISETDRVKYREINADISCEIGIGNFPYAKINIKGEDGESRYSFYTPPQTTQAVMKDNTPINSTGLLRTVIFPRSVLAKLAEISEDTSTTENVSPPLPDPTSTTGGSETGEDELPHTPSPNLGHSTVQGSTEHPTSRRRLAQRLVVGADDPWFNSSLKRDHSREQYSFIHPS